MLFQDRAAELKLIDASLPQKLPRGASPLRGSSCQKPP